VIERGKGETTPGRPGLALRSRRTPPTAWEETLGPRWGPCAESDTFDLALHLLDKLVHHGAENALLRDLSAR